MQDEADRRTVEERLADLEQDVRAIKAILGISGIRTDDLLAHLRVSRKLARRFGGPVFGVPCVPPCLWGVPCLPPFCFVGQAHGLGGFGAAGLRQFDELGSDEEE